MKADALLDYLLKGSLGFGIVLDQKGIILKIGDPIKRLIPLLIADTPIQEYFQPIDHASWSAVFCERISGIKARSSSSLSYKMSIDYIDEIEVILIQCSPLFNSNYSLANTPLKLNDFPEHLLVSEFLFLFGLQTMSMNEVRQSLDKSKEITRLKNSLEKFNARLTHVLNSNQILAFELNLQSHTMDFYPETKSTGFFGNNKSVFKIEEWVRNFVLEEQQEKFLSRIQALNTSDFSIETDLLVRKGEDWQWNSVRIKVLEWNGNQPLLANGVMEVITGQKIKESNEAQTQEEERVRISKDIHDGIGQALVGVRFIMDKILKLESSEEINELLSEVNNHLYEVISETRIIINNLGVTVFKEDGLRGAFEKMVEHTQKLSPIKLSLEWHGREDMLSHQNAIHILRIFQESLINAIKYSRANQIHIYVKNNDSFDFIIEDDGKGFDEFEGRNGFGLKNIKKRARSMDAKVDIISRPGQGTKIHLIIP